MKFAQTLDNLFLRAIADAWRGSVQLRKGDLQKALHQAQRWVQTYAVHGEFVNVGFSAIRAFRAAWQAVETLLSFAQCAHCAWRNKSARPDAEPMTPRNCEGEIMGTRGYKTEQDSTKWGTDGAVKQINNNKLRSGI